MPNPTLAQMGFLDEDTQQEVVYDIEDSEARSDIGTINGKIPSAASSTNKLVDTTAMNDAIGQAVSAAYKPAGNKTVAELTSSLLVAANRGKVYNMTDAGTTTADFVEGAGHPIRVGDDVGICEPTTGTFKFNILSGFIAVDTNPTQGSANPVSSGGVYSEFAGMKNGQSIDSFGDVENALAEKVDKIQGKGLSTNDYDNTAKAVVTTAQDNIKANTKLIKDTVGWSGKNKLAITANTQTINDVTYTVNDDKRIKVNGTASANSLLIANSNVPLIAEKTYKITKGINDQYPQINLNAMNGTTYVKNLVALTTQGEVEFTPDFDGYDRIECIVYVPNGTVISNKTVSIMIYPAEILDDTYEPYAGTTAFPRSEQAVLGAKNLLENTGTTQTKNGVTFTVNADKSVSVNGTATANTEFYLTSSKTGAQWKKILGSKVIMTGCAENGSASTYYIRIIRTNPSWQDFGSDYGTGRILDISTMGDDSTYLFLIGISNGVTINNLVFKPMIRLATDPDDTYVPYAMTNRELTEKVNGISIKKLTASATIASGAYTTGELDATNGNLKALGVVGTNITGVNNTECVIWRAYYDSSANKIKYGIKNTASAEATPTVEFYVLYIG